MIDSRPDSKGDSVISERLEKTYDMDRAVELGQWAFDNCKSYYEPLLEKQMRPLVARPYQPPAFCGYGRAGKDLAAEYLKARYDIVGGTSTSLVALPLIHQTLVAHGCPLSEEKVYSERHLNRMFWFTFLNQFRANDPTLLVRMALANSDIVVGIRSGFELRACVDQGLVFPTIWVQNKRVPQDPTVEYGAEDCLVTVDNSGSRDAYYGKLDDLAQSWFGFRLKSANYQLRKAEASG